MRLSGERRMQLRPSLVELFDQFGDIRANRARVNEGNRGPDIKSAAEQKSIEIGLAHPHRPDCREIVVTQFGQAIGERVAI